MRRLRGIPSHADGYPKPYLAESRPGCLTPLIAEPRCLTVRRSATVLCVPSRRAASDPNDLTLPTGIDPRGPDGVSVGRWAERWGTLLQRLCWGLTHLLYP